MSNRVGQGCRVGFGVGMEIRGSGVKEFVQRHGARSCPWHHLQYTVWWVYRGDALALPGSHSVHRDMMCQASQMYVCLRAHLGACVNSRTRMCMHDFVLVLGNLPCCLSLHGVRVGQAEQAAPWVRV